MAKMKWLWMTLLILTLSGGLVHVLQAVFNYNLLSWFGSWGNWVQGIAGVATLWYGIRQLVK